MKIKYIKLKYINGQFIISKQFHKVNIHKKPYQGYKHKSIKRSR